MILKTCSLCHVGKPLDAFNKSRQARGLRAPRGGHGVARQCRQCIAERRDPTITERRRQKAAHVASLVAQGLKICNVCKEQKPLDRFKAHPASPDDKSWTCAACTNERTRRWRADHPSAFKEWYRANRTHKDNQARQWRAANAERCRFLFARWAKANQGKVNANIMRRHAAKMHATPQWADQTQMQAVYTRAIETTRRTGVQHVVDHIVPLRSRIVCGLHCHHNLQLLTADENRRKSNKFDVLFLSSPTSSRDRQEAGHASIHHDRDPASLTRATTSDRREANGVSVDAGGGSRPPDQVRAAA